MASYNTLERTIRRCMQQLNRTARVRDRVRCRSFSARFPLHPTDDPFTLTVAGHLEAPTPTSSVLPAERRLSLTWTGPITHLALTHDVIVHAALDQRLTTLGTIVEHYLDLAPIGRTDIGITIAHT